MIGDRLDTDILFAQNSGIRSILVFSGVTSIEDYENYLKNGAKCNGVQVKPTEVLNSIKDIIDKKLI